MLRAAPASGGWQSCADPCRRPAAVPGLIGPRFPVNAETGDVDVITLRAARIIHRTTFYRLSMLDTPFRGWYEIAHHRTEPSFMRTIRPVAGGAALFVC